MADVVKSVEVCQNSLRRIRIELTRFQTRAYVDLRQWFCVDDDVAAGEFRPSRKGITLPCALLPDIVKGLEEVKETAAAYGLLLDAESSGKGDGA